MQYSNENNSQAEIGYDLAEFISKFVSPPTIAILATVSFSLWSPIGLGSLYPPMSILLCFWLFAFFPFLPVLYFYRKNVVDLYVSKKETRTPFFLVAIALYSIAALIFFVTNTKIMFLLALGYTFVTIILLVVNKFWKVSVHSAGVTGPIFALIFVFGIIVIPLSLIILLVSWSRIKLKMHTFRQTLAGALIPIAVGFVLYPVFYPLV
jgi:membrane-associated phospholipid phosphatase